MRKLVRDYVVAQVPDEDRHLFYQEEPYPSHLLGAKIMEEAAEVYAVYFNIASTDEHLLDELADVVEVVKEIAIRRGLTFLQVLSQCVIKRARRGGFKEGWVYETEEAD